MEHPTFTEQEIKLLHEIIKLVKWEYGQLEVGLSLKKKLSEATESIKE